MQLPLDLPHRPALGGEDFLVAASNESAVTLIDRWPDWPHHAVAIVGPPGCGKSHLAGVWQAASGALALTPEELAAGMPSGRAVLLDDADQLADEEGLLHLMNWMRETGGSLLMTAVTPPARWPVALPDLQSRLAAVPTAEIGPPDDALLAVMLVKLFADRQLTPDPAVIDYLTVRIERSFAAVRRVVAELDAAALAAQRPVTLPLAREVLARIETAGPVS